LEDVDLQTAFELYEEMNPAQKLHVIRARAKKLKMRMENQTKKMRRLLDESSSDPSVDSINDSNGDSSGEEHLETDGQNQSTTTTEKGFK
jgi:fructose-bisphosphate aldolase class 1